MTEHDKQFDDAQGGASKQLRADLRALFEPGGTVPPEVDRAILAQARRRLARPRRLVIRLRWAAGITAAAAVIMVGATLYFGTAGHNHPSSIIHHQSAMADIDNNGRVDILDAFRLARHIEAGDVTEKNWDLNGDGRIDRTDVDAVAFAAVRL
jgi:hypothetical protein